jgi:hypothetical protein
MRDSGTIPATAASSSGGGRCSAPAADNCYEVRANGSLDNYADVLDALNKLSGTDVLVGIPAGPPREDSPLSNAEIGYLQSTGATVEIDGETVTLPPGLFSIWV